MENKREPGFGKHLYELIELPQGYACVSDRIEVMTDKEALQEAKNSLSWAENYIKILKREIELFESTNDL